MPSPLVSCGAVGSEWLRCPGMARGTAARCSSMPTTLPVNRTQGSMLGAWGFVGLSNPDWEPVISCLSLGLLWRRPLHKSRAKPSSRLFALVRRLHRVCTTSSHTCVSRLEYASQGSRYPSFWKTRCVTKHLVWGPGLWLAVNCGSRRAAPAFLLTITLTPSPPTKTSIMAGTGSFSPAPKRRR